MNNSYDKKPTPTPAMGFTAAATAQDAHPAQRSATAEVQRPVQHNSVPADKPMEPEGMN